MGRNAKNRPRRANGSVAAAVAKAVKQIVRAPKPRRKARKARGASKGPVTMASAPLARGGVMKAQYQISGYSKDKVLISGSDYLGDVHLWKDHLAFDLSINPVSWKGTRVSNVARTYANFTPKRCIVRYVPNVNAAQVTGQLTIGTNWGNNPVDPNNHAFFQTSPGGAIFSAWLESAHVIPLDRLPQKSFYTNMSTGEVDTEPFRVQMLCTDLRESPTTALVVGKIEVSYVFEFSNPQILEEFTSRVNAPVNAVLDPVSAESEVILRVPMAASLFDQAGFSFTPLRDVFTDEATPKLVLQAAKKYLLEAITGTTYKVLDRDENVLSPGIITSAVDAFSFFSLRVAALPY